jgi:hypothetical protein
MQRAQHRCEVLIRLPVHGNIANECGAVASFVREVEQGEWSEGERVLRRPPIGLQNALFRVLAFLPRTLDFIESALSHMIGPEAFHHVVEFVDVEIAAIGKSAAPITLSTRTTEWVARMAFELASRRQMLNAFVGNFELVRNDWRKGHSCILVHCQTGR